MVLASGVGMPGLVFQERRPQWAVSMGEERQLLWTTMIAHFRRRGGGMEGLLIPPVARGGPPVYRLRAWELLFTYVE